MAYSEQIAERLTTIVHAGRQPYTERQQQS